MYVCTTWKRKFENHKETNTICFPSCKITHFIRTGVVANSGVHSFGILYHPPKEIGLNKCNKNSFNSFALNSIQCGDRCSGRRTGLRATNRVFVCNRIFGKINFQHQYHKLCIRDELKLNGSIWGEREYYFRRNTIWIMNEWISENGIGLAKVQTIIRSQVERNLCNTKSHIRKLFNQI